MLVEKNAKHHKNRTEFTNFSVVYQNVPILPFELMIIIINSAKIKIGVRISLAGLNEFEFKIRKQQRYHWFPA